GGARSDRPFALHGYRRTPGGFGRCKGVGLVRDVSDRDLCPAPAPESVRYSPAGFDVVALQLFEQPIDRRAVRSVEDRSSPVLGGELAEVVVYHPLVGFAVQRLGLGLPLRPRRLFGRRCEG